MTEFVELARPKVNLTLAIRGRRADGYHEIASLVAFASAPADRVTLSIGSSRRVSVAGPLGGGLSGTNILDTALDLVAPHLDDAARAVVTLEKVLPVAAGIGGGSADAAALLRALQRAYPDLAPQIDWPALALRLGADVPVCLAQRTAWMTGIGEILAPVAGLPMLPAVLVNPRVPVPADKTARVFRALSAPRLAEGGAAAKQPAIRASCREQCTELDRFANDMTTAAVSVVPAIGEVLDALSGCSGCLLARLSGAGPTAFGIFDDAASAAVAAARLARDHPSWWVEPAVLGGD